MISGRPASDVDQDEGLDADTVIDILIPYWGPEDQLRATVATVLAQTDPRWRLTIVDDAYPDADVSTWVNELQDERLVYLRSPSNVGLVANHQRCLELARAPLMMFLGCDDLLQENYVETVIDAHQRFPDAAIIEPGVGVIDDAGLPSLPLVDRVKGLLRRQITRGADAGGIELVGERLAVSLLRGNWLYWPSLTFRTASVHGRRLRTDYPIIMDLALILDLVVQGASVAVVPTECFLYRRHGSSASSAGLGDDRRFADDRRLFAEYAGVMTSRGWRAAARAARARWTSRLHALAVLPARLRSGWPATRELLNHAFSWSDVRSTRAPRRWGSTCR